MANFTYRLFPNFKINNLITQNRSEVVNTLYKYAFFRQFSVKSIKPNEEISLRQVYKSVVNYVEGAKTNGNVRLAQSSGYTYSFREPFYSYLVNLIRNDVKVLSVWLKDFPSTLWATTVRNYSKCPKKCGGKKKKKCGGKKKSSCKKKCKSSKKKPKKVCKKKAPKCKPKKKKSGGNGDKKKPDCPKEESSDSKKKDSSGKSKKKDPCGKSKKKSSCGGKKKPSCGKQKKKPCGKPKKKSCGKAKKSKCPSKCEKPKCPPPPKSCGKGAGKSKPKPKGGCNRKPDQEPDIACKRANSGKKKDQNAPGKKVRINYKSPDPYPKNRGYCFPRSPDEICVSKGIKENL